MAHEATPGPPTTFFGKRGHELIRPPFWWSLVQPTLQGPLDAGWLEAISTRIQSRNELMAAFIAPIAPLHASCPRKTSK